MNLTARHCLSCSAPLAREQHECSYCGTVHDFNGLTPGAVCPGCGASNRPESQGCVQCRKALLYPCPECRGLNPLGARFCGGCRIEFLSYRQAHRRRALNRLDREGVSIHVKDWLAGGWLKARDIERRLRILERRLYWLPRWRYETRVEGKVQGRNAQTHYRTTTSKSYDHEQERWIDRPGSEPYTVWQDVSKDFERRVAISAQANSETRLEELYAAIGEGVIATEGLEAAPRSSAAGELVLKPEGSDHEAFAALRAQVRAQLEAELLDEVERLELRSFEPRLFLTWRPVWELILSYRRKRRRVRIDGATLEVQGRGFSLLDQWL